MYKVIVAEDEDMIRKGLVFSVPWTELDCTVVAETGDGLHGIQAIHDYKPDIVLADINMPLLNGLQMLEQTKDLGYSAIILTGYSDFQYARRAIEFGVISYCLKPIDVSEVKTAVEQAKKNCNIRRTYDLVVHQSENILEINPVAAFKKNDAVENFVGSIIKYIENHYSEKLTMEGIVNTFHYSETFINKKFKETIGTTLGDYLTHYRITKAIELIKSKGGSVAEIAYKCGFNDYKYFGSVFKKIVGFSPKEFSGSLFFNEENNFR